MSNLRSRRARRRDGCPMAAHDRLPRPLRLWLHEAALPWSPQSALRIYSRALKLTGCEAAALERLARAERVTLERGA
jgi:hypothetical protein